MKTQHTPAPWRTVTDGISHWVEIDGKIIMVTKVNAEANARLIAAAPELLEALKLALQHLVYDGKHAAVVAAKNAINSAEGN